MQQTARRIWTVVRRGVILGTALVVAGAAAAEPPPPQDNAPALGAKQADVTYDNYKLRDGETVDRLAMHYVTLGTPHRNANGEIDNAVLMLHWTGQSGAVLLTPEYKETLYAPGQPLDAQKYFLIIPDNFGHGRSSKPSDGLRAKFPHYRYGDLVDLQHRLVTETLGVKHLHAIVGTSMGGMNAWQWAEAYPDAMDGIMPVVALPAKISGRNLLWRRIVIDDIRADPAWQRGDYTSPPPGFIEGFQVLRMMIDGVQHEQREFQTGDAVETYMAGVAKQMAHADPNDLLYSLEASQDYDPEPGIDRVKARVFALNFGDDEFNPGKLGILEATMKRVKNGTYVVTEGSADTFGHLTMAHPKLWSRYVATFMASLDAPSHDDAAAPAH